MIKDAYIKFVEAQMKGKVREFSGIHNVPASFGWSIPQFDFDHLDDPASKMMWPKSIWDDYWQKGHALICADDFHLPFPECVYIFRFDVPGGKEGINILHLVEQDDEIIGETYFSHEQGWVRAPLQFAISLGRDNVELSTINGSPLPPEHHPTVIDHRSNYTKMIVATLFLRRRGKQSDATVERSPSQADMNRRLAKMGEQPLPPLIRVRAKTEAQMRNEQPRVSQPTGQTRSPHFRRGHYRTLRSGRVIPVRPSAIHGGDDPGRRYLVTA